MKTIDDGIDYVWHFLADHDYRLNANGTIWKCAYCGKVKGSI